VSDLRRVERQKVRAEAISSVEEMSGEGLETLVTGVVEAWRMVRHISGVVGIRARRRGTDVCMVDDSFRPFNQCYLTLASIVEFQVGVQISRCTWDDLH